MIFFSRLSGDFQAGNDLTDSFLHINDVFTPDYIVDIIENFGRPRVILSDHMTLTHTLPSDVQGIFLPLFAQNQANLWQHEDFDNRNPSTESTFCVMSNKKTLNRSLCLRMVEMMEFKNFVYTWSGFGRSTDMSTIVAELDWLDHNTPLSHSQRADLLAPINLPPNILGGLTAVDDVALIITGNRQSWHKGLDQMFFQSVTSLITETFVPTREAVFTEKTVYPMLGLNFPIWVGGFCQAQQWQSFGFDTFDDIINHDYQSRSTLVERCWYALYLNREILGNFELAKTLRTQHMDRLINNRNILLSGGLLTHSLKLIDCLPVEYQKHARECVNLRC